MTTTPWFAIGPHPHAGDDRWLEPCLDDEVDPLPPEPTDPEPPAGDYADFGPNALCVCGRTYVDHQLHDHPFDPAPGEATDPHRRGWQPC